MAILFEIRLTAPQIDLLRQFNAWDEGDKKSWVGEDFGNFVTHVKALLRERLVWFNPKAEQKSSMDFSLRWGITEKGKYLMKVVDLELIDTQRGSKIQGRGAQRQVWREQKQVTV